MAIDDNTSYELTGYQVKDLAQKIRAKADSSSLASVATSGLYSDLTGAPTIPTVYNGTLTITQGGNTLGTFTANSSTNETIDIPAGGSSYTAGNGISIDANNEISIDTSVVAELSDLPTVNDGTLTIQHNGTTKGTFTANQSSASTVNIETIYADDYISTSPIPTTVTTAMIEDGAITTAKIDDEAVTAAKTAFGGNYSTTEVNTGFTWIDGRPIYKKTISCGGGSNQYKAVNHNISNLRRTIKIEGQAYDGNVCIPIPFVATGNGTSTSVQLYVSSTQIVIECGTGRSNLTEMYITLWYTKTTD